MKGKKIKGKKIGDIFLPSMFLPTENRGGIHYSEHNSVPLETMWIVVRTFLIGANVATPPHVCFGSVGQRATVTNSIAHHPILRNRGDIQFSASIAAPIETILFVEKETVNAMISDQTTHHTEGLRSWRPPRLQHRMLSVTGRRRLTIHVIRA